MTFETPTPNLTNLRLLYAGLLGICLAASALGQGNPAGPPAGAGPPLNKNPNVADRSRQVNETELRSVEMTAGTDEERQKRVQTAITNMKEDFARIQVLRNNIARSLVARKPLDYTLITEQTAEINKRSNRLNVYLRARAPQDEKDDRSAEPTRDEMVGALVSLCKLIDSFTDNPALKDAAVVNSQEVSAARENRARADKDLLAIIKLSAGLQKTAERLKSSH